MKKKEDGLTWEYSDRIWQYDYKKAKTASKQAQSEYHGFLLNNSEEDQ